MSASELSPSSQTLGEDTQAVQVVYGRLEGYRKRITALERELEAVYRELEALKAGAGISIIIAGQRFDLAPDEPEPEQHAEPLAPMRSEKARVGTAFLSGVAASEPGNGHRSGVEDSFVL